MPTIRLPANGWSPRAYQRPAWDYLERGGKHAELIWARRGGKDEIALHRTAIAAFERVATYWHMLPLATQARKAIWEAVNPHTGIRRIDEAFPKALRQSTRENEMMIRFVNGSTWQVVGSDNFDALVGSPPAGIVYSEWALSNPAARAYLRPIIEENGGWQLFITTPRGRNHAYHTFKAAQQDPKSFAQILTARDFGRFSEAELEDFRKKYQDEFGMDVGNALFQQEYLCSFDAAILGAVYGTQLADLRQKGRLTNVPCDPDAPVYTAWDLGFNDDTSIWFFQVIWDEIHVLDCYTAHGLTIEDYVKVLYLKGYDYKTHYLPHDARAKTLASGGKSIIEQMAKHLGPDRLRIVPNLSLEDGIQATRNALQRCWFDEYKCDAGLEALSQYQHEYDTDKHTFRDKPKHDWTSHYADAFRMLAIAWREEIKPQAQKVVPIKTLNETTLNEMWATVQPRSRRI